MPYLPGWHHPALPDAATSIKPSTAPPGPTALPPSAATPNGTSHYRMSARQGRSTCHTTRSRTPGRPCGASGGVSCRAPAARRLLRPRPIPRVPPATTQLCAAAHGAQFSLVQLKWSVQLEPMPNAFTSQPKLPRTAATSPPRMAGTLTVQAATSSSPHPPTFSRLPPSRFPARANTSHSAAPPRGSRGAPAPSA